MVAVRFNRLMLETMQVDQYFTMAYAEVDLANGKVRLVQAGHPHPTILRASGEVEFIGSGGLPIGLIEGASYDRIETRLFPGDRLFLVSDGVTECADPDGTELGEEGLRRLLMRNATLESPALLEALVWDLHAWTGGADFRDDVSGVLFDYRGP
jgi:sigma-B regulation protein RsbU (phosphoserine phosphatase)